MGVPGNVDRMTPAQTITSDHLRSLLAAGDGAILGLLEGGVVVIEAESVSDESHRGALEVITRDDLRERLGADPGDDELAGQADVLTATVAQLGG